MFYKVGKLVENSIVEYYLPVVASFGFAVVVIQSFVAVDIAFVAFAVDTEIVVV